MIKVSKRHKTLLIEVLHKRSPDMMWVFEPSAEIDLETLAIVEDAVMREFSATGIGPDGEPNQRGTDLEDVVDNLNRRFNE